MACAASIVMLSACARNHDETNARVSAAVESSGGDARVQAAAARYRSARARADSVTGHETMQLRLRGLSGENLQRDQGVGVSVRIPMTNPWEIARTRDARNEEARVMAHEVESEAVAIRANRCVEGITQSAGIHAAETHERFSEAVTRLRTWAEGWVRGETLGPLESAELMLEIERRMAEQVIPPSAEGTTAVPLPELVLTAALDARPQTVRERIEVAHPMMQRHAAAARAYRALARRERARAAPWFGFVEVGYEFRRDRLDSQDRQAIEARFAINVPLAPRPRHEIARQEALAEAEDLDAQAGAEELSRSATVALASVSSFGARAESLAALTTRAAESEAIALRYLDERHGDPRSVLGLLVEVLRTRLAIVDVRRRAGLAACDLYMATGVSAADWPRR